MKKKLLITGATGFIGKPLLSLIQNTFEVHFTVNSWKQDHFISSSFHSHQVNLLNEAEIETLMRQIKPTHLLHLAWFTKHGQFWNAAENLDWVRASISLIKRFTENQGQRLVVAGTCAEYDWSDGICIENKTRCAPASLYGASKYSLQLVLSAFAKEVGLSFAWGRIFHLYGPNEHVDRLIPTVICKLLMDQKARCTSGDQVRDFMHVYDVANAFLALLQSNVEGEVNVASGHPTSLKEIIHKIGDKLNRKHLIELGAIPMSPKDPLNLIASTERLSNELKWQPKILLDEGLDMTIAWWKERLVS